MAEAAPTRPVLRYHGGKWRLAPWIISHFPPHRVYVEPFGGAASVLMRKPRSYAEVYNDLDGEVVNVFRVLRDPELGAELERRVRLTPFAREEFDLSYLPSGDLVEQARRTLIRSYMGFGTTLTRPNRDGTPQRTGFRNNVTRAGTTPATDWSGFADVIPSFVDRLGGVVVECVAATEAFSRWDGPDTLFYVDPPYVHSTRTPAAGGSHRGYRHELTDDDHRSLADELRRLEGMVVLSGYPCNLYDALYPDWFRVERESRAGSAARRTEVLWLNPRAAEASDQVALSLFRGDPDALAAVEHGEGRDG